jgi:hypothetical protein
MGRAAQLTPLDPDLQKALTQFPNDAHLARLAAGVAHEAKAPLKAPLIHLIKAEYTGLETDPARYSYALKSYFAMLEESL